MNIEDLQKAISVLGEVSANFARMPEEKVKSVTAALSIEIVSSYLTDIALHMARGKDSYDALLEAAKGDTPLNN